MSSHAAFGRLLKTPSGWRSGSVELLLLLAPCGLLLFERASLSLAGLVAWAIWLIGFRPPSRERWMLIVAGCAAAASLVLTIVRQAEVARPLGAAELEARYGDYWNELQAASERALAAVPAPPYDDASRLVAFSRLGELTASARLPGLTCLILDGDRQAIAWGGVGLLHELGPEGAEGVGASVPSGPGKGLEAPGRRLFLQSAASATAVVLRTLVAGEGLRYQLACGESRSRWGRPPLLTAEAGALRELERPSQPWRWGFGGQVEGTAGVSQPTLSSAIRVSIPGSPPLLIATPAPVAIRALRGPVISPALAIGLGLFGLAALRGFALAVLAGTVLQRPRRALEVALLALAGLVAVGAAFGASSRELAVLVVGLAAAQFSWWLAWRTRGAVGTSLGRLGALAATVLGVAAVVLLARLWPQHPLDLAAEVAPTGAETAVRIGLACLLFATLLLAATGAPVAEHRRRLLGLLAGIGIVLAAANHDHGVWGLVPLFGGVLLGAWALRVEERRSASSLLSLALLAMVVSAIAWETGFRSNADETLPEAVAMLLPPAPARQAELAAEIDSYFDRLDLADVAPDALPLTSDDDLAYVVWRSSPLARLDALSAVVLDRPGLAPTSFSYGLPLDDGLEIDLAPARWSGLVPEPWQEHRVSGQLPLVGGGRAVGEIRYWFVPRPGFAAIDASPEDLPSELLRSGAGRSLGGRVAGAGEGRSAVLYATSGEVLASPWREATPALAKLRSTVAAGSTGGTAVETPEGRARVRIAEGGGVAAALFSRELAPLEAIERIGVHVAATLFGVSILLAVGFLLALPRATARDLAGRMSRSYANRLILLFSALLLVPLILLYALLSSTLEERVAREHRLAAEAALSSAQRVLGEYVLTLEPGFGLATAIDDEILVWLSRVIGHDVSLYWGSEVYASSKRELFAAGFLPRRIPGDVWPRMALGGETEASRTARAGAAEYLELYAPLAVPGLDARQTRLFLAMPLLAQQEEATAETALIRRRALLATLAVFLLLAALGTRLARAFTRPIMELVLGTQRIASGAATLGVKTSVLELAALADAIDRMARRIAEGRDQLLREKRLVDGILENVTSGVVYLDRNGRVLLANRVARELLEVAPGDEIADRLSRHPELEGARRFIRERREQLSQATLRLPGSRAAPGSERDWSLVWVPLTGEGEPAALFVVEDISEVLRAQRLEAWAAMAQIIAHEIKNPLTPIRLSTEHLREVWRRDRQHFEEVFDRCTENVLRQVEELRAIASEFSTFSRIPKAERVEGSLTALVREIADGYRAAPPPGVRIGLELEDRPLEARFDPRLLGRALRNLIENAVRVSAGSGEVTIALVRLGGAAALRVRDRGPGVPPEMLARIFEPYFSTQVGGTGLGLSIAQRIAEDHGGSIRAQNLEEGGLEVEITIPLL